MMQQEHTYWTAIAEKIGALKSDGSESGSDQQTKKAFEEILGEEWIKATVDHIVAVNEGELTAMSCLRLIQSEIATTYAYSIYKNNFGTPVAINAVWLIKHIHHPTALNWVNEFLDDENVAVPGLGVLDQLLWTRTIEPDEQALTLLRKASTVMNGYLKEDVAFIRKYLRAHTAITIRPFLWISTLFVKAKRALVLPVVFCVVVATLLPIQYSRFISHQTFLSKSPTEKQRLL